MKRMMAVVMLALMALFFVVPVMAQEYMIQPAPTTADSGLVIGDMTLTVLGLLGIVMLAVVAMVLYLYRDAVGKLANSAPPWMETALTGFIGVADSMVKKTPTTFDDDLLLFIRKEVEAAFAKRDKLATEVQTVPVVDVPVDSPGEG